MLVLLGPSSVLARLEALFRHLRVTEPERRPRSRLKALSTSRRSLILSYQGSPHLPGSRRGGIFAPAATVFFLNRDGNDYSKGSPPEIFLRLLLPLNGRVRLSSTGIESGGEKYTHGNNDSNWGRLLGIA